MFWLILIGYIGGRLCEGAFQLWIASFDIFIWRPMDSFSRLITARRNPNLILLTFGWSMRQAGHRPLVGGSLAFALDCFSCRAGSDGLAGTAVSRSFTIMV